MKDANTAIFQRLAEFAEARDRAIPNRHAPRWVHANPEADAVLIRAQIRRSISFGRLRHLAWIEFDGQHYVASVGFDHEVEDPSFSELEDAQGFDVCLLSELPVFPSASATEVFNVVAASSRDEDAEYQGHDNGQVMALFPALRVYMCRSAMTEDVIWPVFFSICAKESQYGGSWIESDLTGSLSALAESSVDSFPYSELCRSTLDLDPRSLFMSLYRCIEATYAHEKATKLKAALAIEQSWSEIAALLESEMSWRPLEAESLNTVLQHANPEDLREACDCLGAKPGDNVAATAGRAIYRLRNRIVHYRPTNDPFDFESVDWNRICNVLASIAGDVFYRAYAENDHA